MIENKGIIAEKPLYMGLFVCYNPRVATVLHLLEAELKKHAE